MGTQFRLTKEESALMDECRKNSFWYRSVPLMAITTTFMTYRRLNNPGTIPKFYGLKLAGSVFAAYLLGKASYIPECRRLILQRLPNSNLAHTLESKPYNYISDMAQPPEIVPKSTTANIFNTKDDEEENEESPIDKSTSPKLVTYDELRQRNRAEYASKYPAVKPSPPPPPPPQPQLQPVVANDQSTTVKKRSTVRKNQYGDEIYD